VIHPRHGDVGGELVAFLVVPEGGRPPLDVSVQRRQRRRPAVDAEPDDPDVLLGGEGPDARKRHLEGADVGLGDRTPDRLAQPPDIVIALPEELQRDVGVRRVGEPDAGQPRKRFLNRLDRVGAGEIGADEQAHGRL